MENGLNRCYGSSRIGSVFIRSIRFIRVPPPVVLSLAVLFAFAAAPRAARAEELPRGVVLDAVACRGDATQTYALYLPSAYTPEKGWPIIYAFDPGARGKLPVE